MGVSRRAVVTSVGHRGSACALGQLPHQLRVEQPRCRERGRRRGNGDDGRHGYSFGRLADHRCGASPTHNAPEHHGPEHRAPSTGASTTAAPAPSSVAPTSAPPPPVATSAKTTTVDGPVIGTPYGDVQVRVVLRASHIVDVEPLVLPSDRSRSRRISEQAAPLLRTEALQAQSANIDLLSGASYTSEGYAASLQGALDAARS